MYHRIRMVLRNICSLENVAILTHPSQAHWRVRDEVTDNNRGCENIILSR
jgi:hypothetical protein